MKLPVFKAFGATFAYVFTNPLTILRILWLPMAVYFGVSVVVSGKMLAFQAAVLDGANGRMTDPDVIFAAMREILPYYGLVLLAMMVLFPMMLAGLLRHIIRGESPRLPFYFQFGADELRLLFTGFLVLLLFMAAYIGMFAVIGLSAFAAIQIQGPVGLIVSALLSFAAFVGFVWLMLRLSVTSPGAIAERGIGIGPSWRVTKGNVWRLLGLNLLYLIALLLIEIVLLAVMMSGYLGLMADIIAAVGDPEASIEAQRRMLEYQMNMFDMSRPGFWGLMAVGSVLGIYFLALLIGAGGVAYRLMAEGDGA